MDQAASLQADFVRLGALLAHEADGAKAAALARERRMIGQALEALDDPEVSIVDQLADRRRARASNPRTATGDSQSG